MRDYIRDSKGRFADVPGVGDDAPANNSAMSPGGTRTSIPSAANDWENRGEEWARISQEASNRQRSDYLANEKARQANSDLVKQAQQQTNLRARQQELADKRAATAERKAADKAMPSNALKNAVTGSSKQRLNNFAETLDILAGIQRRQGKAAEARKVAGVAKKAREAATNQSDPYAEQQQAQRDAVRQKLRDAAAAAREPALKAAEIAATAATAAAVAKGNPLGAAAAGKAARAANKARNK